MICGLVHNSTLHPRDVIGEAMVGMDGGSMIGGEGCTVEVDESCFGQCFYLLTEMFLILLI